MLYVLFFCLATHTTLWESVPEPVPAQRASVASEGDEWQGCPPANVTFVDSNGECVYLCIDGKRIEPCVTGPFDKMEVVKW